MSEMLSEKIVTIVLWDHSKINSVLKAIHHENKPLILPPLSSAIWMSLGLMAWLASRSTEIRSPACFMLLGVKKV